MNVYLQEFLNFDNKVFVIKTKIIMMKVEN